MSSNEKVLKVTSDEFWSLNDWCLSHLDEDLHVVEDRMVELADFYIDFGFNHLDEFSSKAEFLLEAGRMSDLCKRF